MSEETSQSNKPIRKKGFVEVPASASKKLWREAVRYQLIYSISGLVLGLVCILGGVILFLNGIAGSTSWIAKIIGTESKISDAAPGAVLFVVGLFVVFTTKYGVKMKNE